MARLEDTMFLRLRQRMLDQQAADRAQTGQINLSTARDLSNRNERGRAEENQFAQQRGAADQMNDEPLTAFEDPRMAQQASLGLDLQAGKQTQADLDAARKDALNERLFGRRTDLEGVKTGGRIQVEDQKAKHRQALQQDWWQNKGALIAAQFDFDTELQKMRDLSAMERAKVHAAAVGSAASKDHALAYATFMLNAAKASAGMRGVQGRVVGSPEEIQYLERIKQQLESEVFDKGNAPGEAAPPGQRSWSE